MPAAPRSKKMLKLLENIIGIPPAFLHQKLTPQERELRRKLNARVGRLSR